jgi:hypothetical protein
MGTFEFGDMSTPGKSYMAIQGSEQVFVDEGSVSDVVETMQVQDGGITDSMEVRPLSELTLASRCEIPWNRNYRRDFP